MKKITSSYKDPSGFVFTQNNQVFRAIHSCYLEDYECLMNSGLYTELVGEKIFIEHSEMNDFPTFDEVKKIILPIQIPTISYAYEWSFSMLKEAALCTLRVAKIALKYNMCLKDAPTQNIQFLNNRATLIDSLSFEKYVEGNSWIAYKQFCESFLAPLTLMSYNHSSLNKLLIAYPNGIPIDVCTNLLPLRSRFNLHVNLHFFLQARMIQKGHSESKKQSFFSKQKFETLLQGLYDFIKNLHVKNEKTTWDNYYRETILSKNYLDEKKKIVYSMLHEISFDSLLDLGANEGEFSLLFRDLAKTIIAIDEDKNCIEKLFIHCKKNKIQNILPLINDLSCPSPAVGWELEERPSIFERVQTDVVIVLALIHHLCIGNNLPFEKVFHLLHKLGNFVLIEFVSKEDEKVQELLKTRKDIFDKYSLSHFKESLEVYFEIIEERNAGIPTRTLFLLKKK